MATGKFRVGVSADFTTRAAGLLEPTLREIFDPLPWLEWEYFPQDRASSRPRRLRVTMASSASACAIRRRRSRTPTGWR